MVLNISAGLKQKIESRQATVCVIGLGYVGLPLAVGFAESGLRVIGIDVDESKVDSINLGLSYIGDVDSQRLSALTQGNHQTQKALEGKDNGQYKPSFSATTDYDVLNDADAVIVCVPTPLGKTKDPDLSYIINAANEIARRLHSGMLVVLESTTFPGTTEEVILPCLRNTVGTYNNEGRPLAVGEDFFLAFSPERIDPGNSVWGILDTPKVVGGVTSSCLEVAQTLYGCVVRQVVPVSSPKVAEMVKLLENTFRATNIALVNEIAIICDRLGMDVWEVIDAAKTKPFGFMPFYPGPGLGGHCIPIDPQYLAWKLKALNYNARFIQLAADVNYGMPGYVLGKVTGALNQARKSVNGSRILLLGAAYKENVGDLRESPALDLIRLLEEQGAQVAYHDPYVPRIELDDMHLESVELDGEVLQSSDCIVITTAHDSYDWQWVVDNSPLVVDTRNATRGVLSEPGKVVKL